MSNWIVDSSVAVKWFIPENNSDDATALISKGKKLIVPDLFYPEFANAICRKTRLKEIEYTDAAEIIRLVLKAPLSVYSSAPYIAAAFDIACQMNQSVYDSLYLALALAIKGNFVTADKSFYRAVCATAMAESIVLLGQSSK